MINNPDISIFFLRAGFAFLYLYAAYMNSKDKMSRQWTVENTKPIFFHTKLADNIRVITLFAYGGIALMYLGGISILIGLEARTGALLLAAFTVGGTIIHYRQRNAAKEIALKNMANAELSSIAFSAFAAHQANILKNICLVLILVFVFLNGVGKHVITDILFSIN